MAEGSSLYKIAVDLVAHDGNLAGPFGEVVQFLKEMQTSTESIRRDTDSITAGMARAATEARAFRDALREAAAAARDMAGGFGSGRAGSAPRREYTASEYPPPGNSRRLGYGPPIIDGEWREAPGPYQLAAPPTSRNAPQGGPNFNIPPAGGGGGSAGGGGGGGAVGNTPHAVFDPVDLARAGWNGVTAALRPAMGEQQTLDVIRASRGNAIASIAYAAAHHLQTSTPGTDLTGNYELFRALLSVTQDAGEAASFLQKSGRYGVALEQINPKAGSYATQLEDVARSAEFLGLVTHRDKTGNLRFNEAGATRILGLATSLSQVTEGQFGPNKLLPFLRSAGSAGAELDLSSVMALWPVIQSQGAQRAGTMLQAFNQQFAAGRQSGQAVDMLINAGIIKGGGDHESNKFVEKRGFGVYQILPGGISYAQQRQVMEHPASFIHDYLLPFVDRDIAKHLPKNHPFASLSAQERSEQETNYLTMNASRIPGGSFMSEIARAYLQSQRDIQAAKSLPDPVKAAGDTQAVRVATLTSAMSNLLALLGSDAVPAATKGASLIASAVNHLTGAAQNHPIAREGAGAVGIGVLSGGGLVGTALGLRGAQWAGAAAFGRDAAIVARIGQLGSTLLRLAGPVGLAITALDAAYHAYEWIETPNNGGVASWMRGHHMGWIAPAAVPPSPVQQAPVKVEVTNAHEVGAAAVGRVGRAIAAAHTASPGDTGRAIRQTPGSQQ